MFIDPFNKIQQLQLRFARYPKQQNKQPEVHLTFILANRALRPVQVLLQHVLPSGVHLLILRALESRVPDLLLGTTSLRAASHYDQGGL